MDRVVRGTAPTLYNTFYIDGVPTDPAPDSATVEVVRADGTTLIPTTAASEAGTGRFSLTLTTTETADLDRVEVRWTADFGGVPQTVTTEVEIAGGVLFTIPEARRDQTLSDAAKFPADRIVEARTAAERALEDACGVALLPRYEYETVLDAGGDYLPVKWAKVRTVRSLSSGGSSLSTPDLVVGGSIYWGQGSDDSYPPNNVTIGYEHGLDRPPGETSRVAVRLARHYLVDAPIDDRAIRIDADNGSWLMATPGMRSKSGGSRAILREFGIPEVDAFVEAHGYASSWAYNVPIVR